MLKKILLFFTLAFAFLILLAFNLFNYLHFQQLVKTYRHKINQLEAKLNNYAKSLTSLQTHVQELAMVQLTGKGIYFNSECVPAPDCPSGYHPQIYALPVNTLAIKNTSAKKLDSMNFSTFAVGKFRDVLSSPASPNEVSDCNNTKMERCQNHYGTVAENQKFWRVCLYFDNKKTAAKQKMDTANYNQGAVVVFTQCAK